MMTFSLLLPALATVLLTLSAPVSGEEDCDCGDTAAVATEPHRAETTFEELRERLEGTDDRVSLDLFVMSLCPYGMQAEQLVIPLAAQFADEVALEIHFIANEVGTARPIDGAIAGKAATSPRPEVDDVEAALSAPATDRAACAAVDGTGEGPFRSLHGQPEIDEGRRQLIIRNDYSEHFMPYLLCRARRGPGGDWRHCAEALGLPAAAVDEAALGVRGAELFGNNIRLATRLGVDQSPTLFIDGEEYTGRLQPLAVAHRICADAALSPCDELPPCVTDQDCMDGDAGTVALCVDAQGPQARCRYAQPVGFDLVVLSTEACSLCDTDDFLVPTQRLFPGARIRHIDAASAAGRDLSGRYGVEHLPTYILSADFARTARFDRVRPMLQPVEDSFVVSPRVAGTSYWPRRVHAPGRLDLFVTADGGDPAGTERWVLDVEDAVFGAWEPDAVLPRRLGDSTDVTDVRIHRVLEGPHTDEITSETERRACLLAQQPAAYAAYAGASNRLRRRQLDEDTSEAVDWRQVARQSGVALVGLESCVNSGEGQRLAAAAVALADSLQLRTHSLAALLENRTLVRRLEAVDFRKSPKSVE